jgi:predicted membrane GTPase involved in stress response
MVHAGFKVAHRGAQINVIDIDGHLEFHWEVLRRSINELRFVLLFVGCFPPQQPNRQFPNTKRQKKPLRCVNEMNDRSEMISD